MLATLYTLGAWVTYFVIWYLNALPNVRYAAPGSALERFVRGIPILVGPVVSALSLVTPCAMSYVPGPLQYTLHSTHCPDLVYEKGRWRRYVITWSFASFIFGLKRHILITEKVLKDLMKKRREKVEEIKKKTNYYSTHDLLQKYDDSSPGSPVPLRYRAPVVPATPQRPAQEQLYRQSSPSSPNPNSQTQSSRKGIA